jgi:hypothetical protein
MKKASMANHGNGNLANGVMASNKCNGSMYNIGGYGNNQWRNQWRSNNLWRGVINNVI